MNLEKIYDEIKQNNINKAYVLAIFKNKVELGYYSLNELHFYDFVDFDLCSQLRIFNQDKELRIINIENKIYSKVICEDEYKNILNDEYMFISGNKILNSDKSDFTLLEQVGRKVAVPAQLTEEQLGKGIRLVVRNYYDTDENNQVTISESRLIGLSLDGKEVM